MKFLSLIKKGDIHLAPDCKRLAAEEFSELLSAKEVVELAKQDRDEALKESEERCKKSESEAEERGFEEGLSRWNEQLKFLEEEKRHVGDEMRKAIVPLALTAVKKIMGRELEMKPESVVDIVKTALKPVTQHRRITIYVNKEDLDHIEGERETIKALFEHIDSLAIQRRDDVGIGGCIIETEAGIINAQLDSQLKALEAAFQTFFDSHQQESGKE